MAAINSFNQISKIEFFSKEQELENLKNCIQHCNLQIKNEQRSWTKIIYDNKITIITLLASSLITRFALNSLLSMSMIAFPFVAVPIFYATYKFSSLQSEANDRLIKTRNVFYDVFDKYKGNCSPDHRQALGVFMQEFKDLPKKYSSVDEIIKKYGNNNSLESLTKVVFSQAVKDQRHLDKISGYQTTFHMGSIATFLIALNIDQFSTPYFFLVSKAFLITSVLFTTGIISGCATYNYIKHRKDPEIGKEIFEKNLNHLNDVLGISQEHRAYV